MTLPSPSTARAIGAVALSLAGPVATMPGSAPDPAVRTRSLHVLRHELATTQGWVRVHAAEALIEHGHTAGIAGLYMPELATATPPYRIGVWRVLARVAPTPGERAGFVDRIRAALHDPAAPDRVHAAETLAKLGAAAATDRAPLDAWLATADAPTRAYLLWLGVQLADAARRPAAELALAALLHDAHPVARLRSAYALARLAPLAPATLARLNTAAAAPADSPARPYLLAAALAHSPPDSAARLALLEQLRPLLARSSAGEQLELAVALGRARDRADLNRLSLLLDHAEADARIGGASGLLYLTQ